MGDGAAAVIASILKTRAPRNAAEQHRVGQVIHKSFEFPETITQPGNQTPTASLALLERIAASTTDFGLRLRIGHTKEFVRDAKVTPK